MHGSISALAIPMETKILIEKSFHSMCMEFEFNVNYDAPKWVNLPLEKRADVCEIIPPKIKIINLSAQRHLEADCMTQCTTACQSLPLLYQSNDSLSV